MPMSCWSYKIVHFTGPNLSHTLQVHKIPLVKISSQKPQKSVLHLILKPLSEWKMPVCIRKTIPTMWTRASTRPEVWAVDNRRFISPAAQETIFSSHELFGVPFSECLGELGQRFWPGRWLDICWQYTHAFPCGYDMCPSLQEEVIFTLIFMLEVILLAYTCHRGIFLAKICPSYPGS